MTEPAPGNGRLVLLVDDDRDTREMYAMFLAASGFRVDQAASAHQALLKAEAAVPDVIVTDLALPGMDGVALAQHLRQHSRLARVPIVAVTGYSMESPDERMQAAGITGVLVKPCMPDRLLEEIRGVLGAVGSEF